MPMTCDHILRRFLHQLARTGRARKSATQVGVSLSTLYKHRRKNPSFRALWDEALSNGRALPAGEAGNPLIDEAYRRIFDGTERPVFYQGDEVGTVRDYHDGLLGLLLRLQDKRRDEDRSEQARKDELTEILELIDGEAQRAERRLEEGGLAPQRFALAPRQSLQDPKREGS